MLPLDTGLSSAKTKCPLIEPGSRLMTKSWLWTGPMTVSDWTRFTPLYGSAVTKSEGSLSTGKLGIV